MDRRTLYLHEENCIWLLDEEETAEEQRLKAVPEYLWKVAEYIEQAGKWQGTATELLSETGADGVLPHMLTRKIVEHFDTVFAPKGIHYETHRTSQTRLLKFSHSENDADDANDAVLGISLYHIPDSASLASSEFYLFRSMRLFRRSTLETDCWCGGMNFWTGWNGKRSIKPKTRTRRLSGLMNSFLRTLVVVFVSRKETMQRERHI